MSKRVVPRVTEKLPGQREFLLAINAFCMVWACLRTNRPLLFTALFLILAFALFVLTGGFFALLMSNSGSSRLPSRAPGLEFVYPRDVNNLTPQETVLGSLVISFGTAALATIFFTGIFLAVRWGVSEARNRAPGQPAISKP